MKGVTLNTYIIVCLLECIFWITDGQRKSPMEGTVSPKVDIRIEKNRNETNEHESSIEYTAMTRDYATEVNTQIIPETETKHAIGPITQADDATKGTFSPAMRRSRLPPGVAYIGMHEINTSHTNKFEENSPSTQSARNISQDDQTGVINTVDVTHTVGSDALEATTDIEIPFSEATMKELHSVSMSTEPPDRRMNASTERTDELIDRLVRTQLVLISHFYKIGITVIGLVGNALNLVVLNAPTMRRAPSHIYMSALACSDMVYLLHTLPFSISGCGGQSNEIFREIYGSILVYSIVVLS